MKTIVFVCTGNTCRSPMAEGIFRVLAEKYGLTDVTCTSCGTCAYTGLPANPYAVSAASAYGADISTHRSRALTQYLLEEGDLFVCMTQHHALQLLRFLPCCFLPIHNPPDHEHAVRSRMQRFPVCWFHNSRLPQRLTFQRKVPRRHLR